jgi:hypothetical protein
MRVALLAVLLLCGCAETRIYEDGKLVCVIRSDATNVNIRTYKGGTFHADTLNVTEPIKAYGGEVASIVGSLGTAAATAAAVIK